MPRLTKPEFDKKQCILSPSPSPKGAGNQAKLKASILCSVPLLL